MHPFRHILLWLALLGPCAAAASGRGGEIDTLVTVEDVRITERSLKEARTPIAVSYTHLTLPTKRP